MQPVSYNQAKIYCGAVFRFSFRLNRAGAQITPDEVTFTLSDKPGGTEVWAASTSDSPLYITVDSENIWTVEMPSSVTASLEEAELYMQIDAVDDGETEPERWIIGNVKVYQNATQ